MKSPAATFSSSSCSNRFFARIAVLMGVLSIVCLVDGGMLRAAGPIPTRTIYTSKPRFRIPFRYDAAELKRLAASHLELFVSNDRGIKWLKSQSVAPEEGRFTFNAPSDGEYWFAVRTVSRNGNTTPAGNTVKPGLKVIVDTSPPQLHLALRQTRPGWVQLTWNTQDEHLDPMKLRLQYKQADGLNWKPLSIIPKADGQTQWSIPHGGTVAVRGTAYDFAGNIGKGNIQTSIVPAQDIVPEPNVPNFNKPVASSPPSTRDRSGNRLQQQFPVGSTPTFKTVAPQAATPPVPGLQTPGKNNSFVSSSQPLTKRWEGDQQEKQNNSNSAQQQELQESDLPFRVVNSRVFSIGYKIDDVGPSGVSAVEVYMSEDAGASWRKYGSDSDRKSPVRIKVPKEGTYGLAMRVRSGVGLSSDPPLSGEKPDIMVVVDTTAPLVKLLPLQQGQGAANNQILIHWEASDKNFGGQPISLFYSGTVDGPWQPISGALGNTGRYLWTVGRGVPSKLYIRIKAQDSAGNSQIVGTNYPVLVDLSRPRARIVDIEPESNSSPR